jgi:hypothetical protein
MDLNREMEWKGSLLKNGSPLDLPVEILFQLNKEQFIEKVLDHISSQIYDGVIPEADGWPWSWEDSQMTDYSYIFDERKDKVYMVICGGRLLDPIKIIQGIDIIGADIGYGKVDFPKMTTERSNIIKLYG